MRHIISWLSQMGHKRPSVNRPLWRFKTYKNECAEKHIEWWIRFWLISDMEKKGPKLYGSCSCVWWCLRHFSYKNLMKLLKGWNDGDIWKNLSYFYLEGYLFNCFLLRCLLLLSKMKNKAEREHAYAASNIFLLCVNILFSILCCQV